MGRKRSSKKKILRDMHRALDSKFEYGRKKHKDTKEERKDRIYSKNTLYNYKRHCKDFYEYLKESSNLYEMKTYRDGVRYIKDYAEYLRDVKGNKESSISTKVASLTKLYGVDKKDIEYKFDYATNPDNITRGRNGIETRFVFDPKYKDLIRACSMLGLRRNELEQLKKESLNVYPTYDKDLNIVLRVDVKVKGTTAKGGRSRTQEVIIKNDKDARFIQNYVNRRCNENDGKFGKVPSHFNVHWFRHVYAEDMYKEIARDISTLDKSEIYTTRGEKENRSFDKQALEIISKNLGHNRLNVVVKNYLFSTSYRY